MQKWGKKKKTISAFKWREIIFNRDQLLWCQGEAGRKAELSLTTQDSRSPPSGRPSQRLLDCGGRKISLYQQEILQSERHAGAQQPAGLAGQIQILKDQIKAYGLGGGIVGGWGEVPTGKATSSISQKPQPQKSQKMSRSYFFKRGSDGPLTSGNRCRLIILSSHFTLYVMKTCSTQRKPERKKLQNLVL